MINDCFNIIVIIIMLRYVSGINNGPAKGAALTDAGTSNQRAASFTVNIIAGI